MDERPKWFGPVVGQLFHQSDTVGIGSRHGDSFGVGPRDDDLAMIPISAAFIEVVWGIEDCKRLATDE